MKELLKKHGECTIVWSACIAITLIVMFFWWAMVYHVYPGEQKIWLDIMMKHMLLMKQ